MCESQKNVHDKNPEKGNKYNLRILVIVKI